MSIVLTSQVNHLDSVIKILTFGTPQYLVTYKMYILAQQVNG
jgi:hypothetical protein